MKILHISDSHGYAVPLPDRDRADVIVHSGDFLPNKTRGMMPFEADWQEHWLIENLDAIAGWLGTDKPVLILRGNHDFVDPAVELEYRGLPYQSLSSRRLEVGGLSFYGYPYTPTFTGEWWGELSPEREREAIQNGPMPHVAASDLDVLVSHGPIYGVRDRNRHGERCGSKLLREYLGRMDKLPKAMLCGHIHESAGVLDWRGMLVSNAACTSRIVEVT